MSSSDSWTLIGLTILVVLLLFYLSKKMICGTHPNGQPGESPDGSGGGINNIGHHQQGEYYDEYHPPPTSHHDPYGTSSSYQDQNPQPGLATDFDYNFNNHQQHEDIINTRSFNINPSIRYNSNRGMNQYFQNPPRYQFHYPSQSPSLRQLLLEICNDGGRNRGGGGGSIGNSNDAFCTGNDTNTIDNQHCHDLSTRLDSNVQNDPTNDSCLAEVLVISSVPTSRNPTASSPVVNDDGHFIVNDGITTETRTTNNTTVERKRIIETQLRAQVLRMVQAERDVRRLVHLLSSEQGLNRNTGEDYISPSSPPPQTRPPPRNNLLQPHHQNYFGISPPLLVSDSRNDLILSAQTLYDHENSSHPIIQVQNDQRRSNRDNLDLDSDQDKPPPPYEECIS